MEYTPPFCKKTAEFRVDMDLTPAYILSASHKGYKQMDNDVQSREGLGVFCFLRRGVER